MTETVRGAVERVREDPKSVKVVKSYETNFAEVLPEHVEARSFVGSALAALRRDPELLKAAENSPTAFLNTLMQCAVLGHLPGTKEYYLTRRFNGKTKKEEISGIEGYRGVIERMYRSGAVASVEVREVCEKDRFDYVAGVHDKPIHEVDWFSGDRGEIVGVYAYATLTTGATSRVVILSRADIEATKARSDSGKKNFGPWVTDYRAMAWKTAAHRLEPWVPTSAEYRREQLRAAAAADSVRTTRDLPPAHVDPVTGELDGDVVDADVVEDGVRP